MIHYLWRRQKKTDFVVRLVSTQETPQERIPHAFLVKCRLLSWRYITLVARVLIGYQATGAYAIVFVSSQGQTCTEASVEAISVDGLNVCVFRGRKSP